VSCGAPEMDSSVVRQTHSVFLRSTPPCYPGMALGAEYRASGLVHCFSSHRRAGEIRLGGQWPGPPGDENVQ
jgi:hypothetical protein